MKNFALKFPRRFFDVGIAEEHAVTFAAGMAANGLHPVVAIYSTFIQRAYDQILHDVCLQNLPVTFCLDRAGIVGEDGATHHGVFDMAFLRTMPNISILAPKDENELRQMFFAAVKRKSPVAIRYPRGAGYGVKVLDAPANLAWGKSEIVYGYDTADVSIFAVGSMVNVAIDAARFLRTEKISANVINARFVKPLDVEILRRTASRVKLIATCEEGALNGGCGASVAEFLADENISVPLIRFGISDNFVEHGTRAELLESCGLTAENIYEKILERFEVNNGQRKNFYVDLRKNARRD